MPVKLDFKIVNNTFLVEGAAKTTARTNKAVQLGLKDAAEDIRDFFKNDILAGSIVDKRTGQLARSLWIQSRPKQFIILFRGMHKRTADPQNNIPNALLAQFIDEGLAADGVRWVGTRNHGHPGIAPHHFIRKGLQRRKARSIALVRASVNAEFRRR